MSRSEGAARTILEGFLPGWLGGGDLALGLPLGEREVAALDGLLAAGRVPPSLGALRAAAVAELAAPGDPLDLGPGEGAMIAAVHNLLALQHPALARLDAAPRARLRALRFTARLVERLRVPRGRAEALAAHALVSPLFRARRTDVTFRYWLGRREYVAREVPSHLLRLPRLRRVRVDRRTKAAPELLDAPGRVLLGRLLLASPLTDLAEADRVAPSFSFGGTARWLGDPELCRGLIYRWASRRDPVHTGGVLVQGLLTRLRGGAGRDEALLLLRALYHLHLVHNLQAMSRQAPEPRAGDPWLTPATPAGRLFVAFFKLVHRGPEVFGLPEAGELGEALSLRLSAYEAALQAVDTRREDAPLGEALRERLHLLGYPGRSRIEARCRVDAP